MTVQLHLAHCQNSSLLYFIYNMPGCCCLAKEFVRHRIGHCHLWGGWWGGPNHASRLTLHAFLCHLSVLNNRYFMPDKWSAEDCWLPGCKLPISLATNSQPWFHVLLALSTSCAMFWSWGWGRLQWSCCAICWISHHNTSVSWTKHISGFSGWQILLCSNYGWCPILGVILLWQTYRCFPKTKEIFTGR